MPLDLPQKPEIWLPSRPAIVRPAVDLTTAEAERKMRLGMLPGITPVIAGRPNVPTKLLMHCEGANGSTSFVDSSFTGIVQTVYGNVQISTAAAKFGSSSILFDGTGDALYSESAVFDLSGPFTMEGFYNIVARSGTFQVPLFDLRPSTGGNGIRLSINTSEQLSFYQNENIRATSGVLTAGIWYHVALTKDASNVYRAFLNGTQFGSNYTDATAYASGACTIGQYPDVRTSPTQVSYQGYMDELRFSKGVARYTSSFTPPTAPFGPYD
ncbi:MAG: LamG domain-containing protein [Mesorhizobium sp.]|uniref:LamG domain-containing protein n=1 Tax=Mesorhizobium sp. TaxID=1871066 RepID=UPI000FE95C71|nr:LamG domain-containing protein [Mesorhizobium sp.]RWM19654.1 MAG: LamG domain-containing protein [Mesorhizobium sp.]